MDRTPWEMVTDTSRLEKSGNLFDMFIYTCIMQIRAENPNLVSDLSN